MTSEECDICHKLLSSSESLAYHRRITHKSNLFENSLLKNYELLEDCGDTPKAKCLVCKVVVLPRNLSEHLKRHFQSFTCEECGKVFQAKKDLKSHKEQHIAVQVVCPECGLAFGSKVVYRSHKIRKHSNKESVDPLVSCDLCQKVVRKASLKKHLRDVHAKSNPKKSKKESPAEAQKQRHQIVSQIKKKAESTVVSSSRKTRVAKVTLKSNSIKLGTDDPETPEAETSQSASERDSKPTSGGGNARRKSKSIPRKTVNPGSCHATTNSNESGDEDELDVTQFFTQPSDEVTVYTQKMKGVEELHSLSAAAVPDESSTQLTSLTRVSHYLTPLEGISFSNSSMMDPYYNSFTNEPIAEVAWPQQQSDSDSNLDGSKNYPAWLGGQHGSIGAALTQAIGLIGDNYGAVLPL